MVVVPQTEAQFNVMAQMLQDSTGVFATPALRLVGWVTDGTVKMVVGFDGFLGQLCQIHVAMAKDFAFTPKEMLRFCFGYAFEHCGMETIIGVVNSLNEKAMRYDEHLGFKEKTRWRGVGVGGGDIVVLELHKHECRYLRPEQKSAIAEGARVH